MTRRKLVASALLGAALAARAKAAVFCAYDGKAFCLTASTGVAAVPAEVFKGDKKPLLVLVALDDAGKATKNIALILTEEKAGSAKEAARIGLEEMRLAAGPYLHPEEKPSPAVLRKGLTAYGYGNGCADSTKCRPMNFLYFRVGARVLKAACPPVAREACVAELASLGPVLEKKK
jgi:hypothetical protein